MKQSALFWFVFFALGLIGLMLIEDVIRPQYRGQPGWGRYLLGVGPNYFAAVSLPAFGMLMLASAKSAGTAQRNRQQPLWCLGVSVIGLGVWEFM